MTNWELTLWQTQNPLEELCSRSHLAWDYLRTPEEELERVPWETDVWYTLLSCSDHGQAGENGWIEGWISFNS